jgi:hypothetical protein
MAFGGGDAPALTGALPLVKPVASYRFRVIREPAVAIRRDPALLTPY